MTTEVPYPREEVYDFLDVMSNHEPFTNHMLRDWKCRRPRSRNRVERVQVTASAGGRTDSVEIEVVAAERPTRIVERNVGAGGRRVANGIYVLAELPDGGTRVTFEYAWQRAPLGERLASPLVRGILRRGNERSLPTARRPARDRRTVAAAVDVLSRKGGRRSAVWTACHITLRGRQDPQAAASRRRDRIRRGQRDERREPPYARRRVGHEPSDADLPLRLQGGSVGGDHPGGRAAPAGAARGRSYPIPGQPVGEAMRGWWKHISDPSLWPNERLFFEIYSQALQGRPHTTELLDGIVDDWLDPITEINVSLGLPRAAARASARLGVAVTRGLLLDLLATNDRTGVDDAMDAFIDVYETWLHARARSA